MQLLDFAIMVEGTTTKLARTLGVGQSCVGNWRSRGVPLAWRQLLEARYGKRLQKFVKQQQQS